MTPRINSAPVAAVTTRDAILRALSGPDWMQHGACNGTDPNLFHPGRGEDSTQAKAVCQGCAVRDQCLEHAIATGEKFGIWGGLSERERRRVRRERAEAAQPDKPPRRDGYKWCPDCQGQRPIAEFWTNSKGRDGLQHYCKTHDYARQRASRSRNRGAA